MTQDDIKDAVLDALIVATEAQLRGLKRLRQTPAPRRPSSRVGLSQVDMVEDILGVANESLHIGEIIDRVEKAHGVRLDRESIVSALTKKVTKGDRFARTGKNTFALKGGQR